MTSSSVTLPLQPWVRSEDRYDHARKLLFRGMWQHRVTLVEQYPDLILPSVEPELRTHAAALILAWERWDQASGRCPDCEYWTFAADFGGMLSVGLVSGVCIGCGLISTRNIRGMSEVLRGRDIAVQGTPFEIALSPSRWRFDFRGIPAELVAALRWCGVKELPKPKVGDKHQLGLGAHWPFPLERRKKR